ncbi:MAG: methyltransferase domain-containing protein [Candidatus Helarchaeota archaeon]|nr:methyltransferase domain-containing protein [Candidatus Helarchaeota archaeon]
MCEFEANFYDSKAVVQYQLGLKLIDQLQIQDGETILDIGCGTGRLTLELAKRTPNGSVIGLDRNSDMIKKALENLGHNKELIAKTVFIEEDILHYEPSLQFNAIYSNSALHWVQETQALYQKIYALLAPGGRLAAQMPAKGSLNKFTDIFLKPIHMLNLTSLFKNWDYPIKFIPVKTLQRILSSIGYVDLKVWEEDQQIQFHSPQEVLDFLKTASLVPILSRLPPETKEEYLNCLLDLIKQQVAELLNVNMRRLYVNARKGRQ